MAATTLPDDCAHCHQPIGPDQTAVYVTRVKTTTRKGYRFDGRGPHSGGPVKPDHVRILHLGGKAGKFLYHLECYEQRNRT